jgi:hypothetical protein
LFAGLLNKGFRGSLLLIILIYVVAAVVCYLAPNAIEQEYYPNLFYNYFAAKINNALAITLLNYLFIGTGVLLVSLISVNQEITDKLNYFPVFLYLLISVSVVNAQQVSSQLFTNVFVLFAVYRLLDTYRKDKVLGQLFEAAFWLSCSAFVTISSVICFPLYFIILLILRPFFWREWAVAITGLFIPVIIYECMAYLTDFNQLYLLRAVKHFFMYLKPPSFSEYFLPVTVTLFVLLVAAILQSVSRNFGNTVKKQRAKSILLWFLAFSLLGFFSGGANSSSILLVYAFPIAFFVGDFLFQIKRLKITNTLLTILLLSVLVIYLGKFGAA